MESLNTRQQGDVGVAAAVLHYTKLGYAVSIPTTESCRYDLIIDLEGKLFRVQCKTTRHKPGNSRYYYVNVATCGGNQSWNKKKRLLDASEFDILFVYCEDESVWIFPSREVHGKGSIALSWSKKDFHVSGPLESPE